MTTTNPTETKTRGRVKASSLLNVLPSELGDIGSSTETLSFQQEINKEPAAMQMSLDALLESLESMGPKATEEALRILAERQRERKPKLIAKWKEESIALGYSYGLTQAEMFPTVLAANSDSNVVSIKTERKPRTLSPLRFRNPENPAEFYHPAKYEAHWATKYLDQIERDIAEHGLTEAQVQERVKAMTNPDWLESKVAKLMPDSEKFSLPGRKTRRD
jgi:hypothetical protein